MTARNDLVRLLRLIFSAERGAALAYRGHAASLHDPDERARVATIRLEELDHRQRVGAMLADLHAPPERLLEIHNLCIGVAIGAFCRVGGWYLPMYGAGWLERRNIVDYERAARLALECACPTYAAELLDLAEAEWEHERFFREKAASHWLSHLLPVWTAPGPKSAIRQGVSSAPAPGRTSLRVHRHRLLF